MVEKIQGDSKLLCDVIKRILATSLCGSMHVFVRVCFCDDFESRCSEVTMMPSFCPLALRLPSRMLLNWLLGQTLSGVAQCPKARLQPFVKPGNRNQSSRKCLHTWLL